VAYDHRVTKGGKQNYACVQYRDLGDCGNGGGTVVLVGLRPLLADVRKRFFENLHYIIRGVNALKELT
jgi:hypothetical protein